MGAATTSELGGGHHPRTQKRGSDKAQDISLKPYPFPRNVASEKMLSWVVYVGSTELGSFGIGTKPTHNPIHEDLLNPLMLPHQDTTHVGSEIGAI